MNNLETNEKLPELRGSVNLGNNILGRISNRNGDLFNLERLWPKISKHSTYNNHPIENPTTAYIRTESEGKGNIYKVDSDGTFTNCNTGETYTFTRKEMNNNLTFEIGKEFHYGQGGNTSKVTEIVYHDDSKHKPDEMKSAPIASLIINDFDRKLAKTEK